MWPSWSESPEISHGLATRFPIIDRTFHRIWKQSPLLSAVEIAITVINEIHLANVSPVKGSGWSSSTVRSATLSATGANHSFSCSLWWSTKGYLDLLDVSGEIPSRLGPIDRGHTIGKRLSICHDSVSKRRRSRHPLPRKAT